jgi:hypothetical protein
MILYKSSGFCTRMGSSPYQSDNLALSCYQSTEAKAEIAPSCHIAAASATVPINLINLQHRLSIQTTVDVHEELGLNHNNNNSITAISI